MGALWEDADRGLCVVRLTEATEVQALIAFFEGVAAGEGWQPAGALRRWGDRSVYLALEVEGQAVGGLQLVLPDAAGRLPYQAIWEEIPVDPASGCAHVMILALAKDCRGPHRLFWPLVVELWRYCVGAGIATLFFEVTPRVLPLYRRLGWPLQILGERRRHWGEECYLCTLGIPEVAAALLRRAAHTPSYRPIVAQAFRLILPAGEQHVPSAGGPRSGIGVA